MIKRIIPCIDFYNGRIVKGVNFNNLIDLGDPLSVSIYYNDSGADELVFLDISATIESRVQVINYICKINSKINIPLIIGGGINDLESIKNLLNSGADKISINSFAVNNYNFINEVKNIYGCQCIIIALDYKKIYSNNFNWVVFKNSGKKNTYFSLNDFIINFNNLGIGEFLLTSIDKDGTNKGFDLDIIYKISKITKNSIIVSGGFGNYKDLLNLFKIENINAFLGASVFHSKKYNILDIKNFLYNNGILVKF